MGPVETRDPAGRVVPYAARITRRQRLILEPLSALKIIRSKRFTAARPWGALDIASICGRHNGYTPQRLHPEARQMLGG
ncbi:hypothetical protein AYM40_31415 [Paraburkholderia phytofirmans OLGA172]|uniref:Uncharacterized protein n=1 Tax=Paraburkholderia phytofirmans OLGA172 TaxID=1417228 RepID=A0A160FTY7_9BURK|nr:hypothetical protein AYM40_31415 [Paraburkholderia phytofirmans OLGA172]